MDVVDIMIDGFNFEFRVVRLNFFETGFEVAENSRVKNFAAVFCGKDDVKSQR